MCGIYGFSRLTPTTRFMSPLLAWAMEDRGKDSWGATDGFDIIRHVGPITSSYELPEEWERGIFHTRAASVGAATEENAHPFRFTNDARTIIGIHNGHINNHQELNKDHTREFAVDSMHIFAHLAAELPTTQLRGWGAIAWYEISGEYPEGRLSLARFNMDNLTVAKLNSGEIVFASTESPIRRAALMAGTSVKTCYTIDPYTQYYLVPQDPEHEGADTLYKGISLPFGERNTTPVNHGYSGTHAYSADGRKDWNDFDLRRGYGTSINGSRRLYTTRPDDVGLVDRHNNVCMKPNCTNKVAKTRKHEVLCYPCLAIIKARLAAPVGTGVKY